MTVTWTRLMAAQNKPHGGVVGSQARVFASTDDMIDSLMETRARLRGYETRVQTVKAPPAPVALIEHHSEPVEPVEPVEPARPTEPRFGLKWKRIVAEVCDKHRVGREELMGPGRRAPLILARNEAMFRLREECGWSYPRVGRFFERDHSTVIHAVRRHIARMEQSHD